MLKPIFSISIMLSVIILIATYGKDVMTRFEHRTFTCNSSLTGTFELIVNKVRIGSPVKLVRLGATTPLEITGINGSTVIAVSDDWSFSINLETNQVIAKDRAELAITRCRTTTFSM